MAKRNQEEIELLKKFIKEYNYGHCIMFATDSNTLFVYWKHWSVINWRDSPKVYLGKIKKQIKPTYLWLD